jgi:tetratricopeptide (TPR) repeat protein
LVIAFAGIEVGLAQRDLGEHVAAIATLTRVEQGTATLAYRPVLVMARFYLATVHRALGQYVIAARLLTDVLAEHREFGARGDEVGTLIELGTLAFDYPDAGDPQDYFRQALAIARDIGLEVPAAEALAGLDRCLHHAGDPKWRHEEAGGCDHLGEETLTIHHSGAV